MLAGDRKTRIDDALRNGTAQRKIPVAVGMVANAHTVTYAGAFGAQVDSIFQIASMTKAITTVAALQLVERGKVKLDAPVEQYLPALANLQVLEGDKLRPARNKVTLKHLLTHTSGICYDTWDGDMFRYVAKMGSIPTPPPLMFEPGTRWQYGMGVDWAGRLVEKISGVSLEEYFQTHILKPLGMVDTSYILPASKLERLVPLKGSPRVMPTPPKEFNGGGGLYSTTADYVKFMQMILQKGGKILQPKTVASMKVNQIGAATAGKMKSYRPDRSSDVDIQPGHTEKWGLGFLINTTAYEKGRSAGSLAWAGLFNTFYWIDPRKNLCAVLMMQFLPFVDKEAVGLLGDFEKAVYQK